MKDSTGREIKSGDKVLFNWLDKPGSVSIIYDDWGYVDQPYRVIADKHMITEALQDKNVEVLVVKE